MSSDQKRPSQPDAFAALQQLMAQSPSAAALQRQLAQAQGQFRTDASTVEPLPIIQGEQYLVFLLADYEIAVKAEHVQGVERLGDVTPVPNVASWVRGVMNLRGAITSVVDLRLFLDLEQQRSYTARTRLLSLQYNDMVICLIVDGVSEMLPIPSSAMVNGNNRQSSIPSWAVPYVSGSALHNNRFMLILDVPRLLFSEKMHRYAL